MTCFNHRQIDKYINRQTIRQHFRPIDRQTDRQTNRWPGSRHFDGRHKKTDNAQAEKETYIFQNTEMHVIKVIIYVEYLDCYCIIYYIMFSSTRKPSSRS